jgi:hypothetical protein
MWAKQIKELVTYSNNKYIMDFYAVMGWFNKNYRTRAKLVKDENDIPL